MTRLYFAVKTFRSDGRTDAGYYMIPQRIERVEISSQMNEPKLKNDPARVLLKESEKLIFRMRRYEFVSSRCSGEKGFSFLTFLRNERFLSRR